MDEFASAGEALIPLLPYLLPIIAVFARLSVFIYLVPVIGEVSIPMRVRLGVAFLLTWLVVPFVLTQVPASMMTLPGFLKLIISESLIGLTFGLSLRLMVHILQILGNIVSQGLSISQVLGEGIASEPNTTISTLAMLAGVTVLVTYDFQIWIVQIFHDSYISFPLGKPIDTEAAASLLTNQVLMVFRLSVSLAVPFLLMNFVYNLILGFLNRAMPQLMVSFVGMPFITGVGLCLLAIGFGAMLLLWWESFEAQSISIGAW